MKVEGDRKRKSQLGKESEKEKKEGGRKKGNEREGQRERENVKGRIVQFFF